MNENGHSSLASALVAAQAEMPAVEKDSENPHFRSKFTSLDHLIAKTRPVLNRHGLSITQWPSFTAANSSSEEFILVHTLTTRITHSSGESTESMMPLIVGKNDMQGLGSALTYAKRYAWAAALGISTDEDDDGNAASRAEVAAKPKPVKPPVTRAGIRPADAAARRKMQALFKEAGINDRADRLLYTTTLIGREVATSTDLTASEVDTVCNALTAAVAKAGRPPNTGQGEAVGGPVAQATSDAAGPGPPRYSEERKTAGPTEAQSRRLDELVTQMMENSTVTINDLWVQLAVYRKQLPHKVIDELGGRSKNGVLKWAPLKAALTRSEAGDLIDHLLLIQREGGLDPDLIPF